MKKKNVLKAKAEARENASSQLDTNKDLQSLLEMMDRHNEEMKVMKQAKDINNTTLMPDELRQANRDDIATGKDKMKFYSLAPILKTKSAYNMIFGERSNGKTFASLKYGIEQYFKTGKRMAYVRRWREDFKGKRGQQLFEGIVNEGIVKQLSNGHYDNITYWSSRWYFSTWNEALGKFVRDEDPFCFAFALTETEHDKSTSYDDVTTIIFDEFLTRSYYLPDEFVLFMNTISTIARYRHDVTIFMLGNTVNKYCPYFKEMGLINVLKMNKGSIDVYTYGTTELRVAVEYADSPVKNKPSDFYFAFNNPKLNMITGGAWEIAMYPHCPIKFTTSDIVFIFFIEYNEEILQCEVISKDSSVFTYIHRKTSPIKDENNDIIYTQRFDHRPNFFRNILKPVSDFEKGITLMFRTNKVFYQDNDVGEVVRSYLQFCSQDTIVVG